MARHSGGAGGRAGAGYGGMEGQIGSCMWLEAAPETALFPKSRAINAQNTAIGHAVPRIRASVALARQMLHKPFDTAQARPSLAQLQGES